MIDAKLLATHGSEHEPPDLVVVYGVWIPRKGDNLRIAMEVVANFGTNLTAELYQKNYADVGNGTSTAVSTAFNGTTGRQTMEVLGAKELVRLKLTLDRGEVLSDGDVGLVLFRFLQPVWFEAVKV